MAIDWALGSGNNALSAFQFGAQLGQQKREQQDQREYRNALVAERQATAARQKVQDAASEEKLQREKQAQQVALAGGLAKAVKAGQLDYGRALQIAQQRGLDVSTAPATADPAWLDEQIAVADVFAEKGHEPFSNYGKIAADEGLTGAALQERVRELWRADQAKVITTTAGGAAGVYTPGQGYNPLIAPNPGGQSFGAPVGGAPAGGADEWETVKPGGGAGNSVGGFP